MRGKSVCTNEEREKSKKKKGRTEETRKGSKKEKASSPLS